MQYSVKLTPRAIVQIQEIVSYISKVLMVPNTAEKWADHLENEIASLDTMPERHPVVDFEPWKSRGYHVMPVKNFLIYYYISNSIVWVTAVVYGKRDQLSALIDI